MQDRATEALRCAYGLIEQSEKIAAIYPDGHLIHETASSIARSACRIIEQIQTDDGCVRQVEPQSAGHPTSLTPVDDPAFDV